MWHSIVEYAKNFGLSIDARFKNKKYVGLIHITPDGDFVQFESVQNNDEWSSKPTLNRGNAQRCNIAEDSLQYVLGLNADNDKTVSKKYQCWVDDMTVNWCDADITVGQSFEAIVEFIKKYDTDVDFREKVIENVKSFVDIDSKAVKDSVTFVIDYDDGMVCILDDVQSYDGVYNFYCDKTGAGTVRKIHSSLTGDEYVINSNDKFPDIKLFGTSIALFSANNASFESYGLTDRDVSGVALQDAELIAAFIDNCENNKDDFLNSDFKILFFYETNGTPVMGDNVINPLSPGSGSNIFTYDRMNADVDVDVDGVARKQLLLDFSNAVYNHKLIDFKSAYRNITDITEDTKYHLFEVMVYGDKKGRASLHEISGSYFELLQNYQKWYEDSMICVSTDDGENRLIVKNPFAILRSCATDKSDTKAVGKEFSSIRMSVLQSCYKNTQLPRILYQRALRNIENEIVSASVGTCYELKTFFDKAIVFNNKPLSIKRNIWFQILKIYLCRKGYDVTMAMECDNVANYCGQLFAVYESLQCAYHNNGNIGRTLAQTYLPSVLRRPNQTFVQMQNLVTVYLDTDNISLKQHDAYVELMGKLSEKIGTSFPVKFTEDEKGSFILGYRAMQMKLTTMLVEFVVDSFKSNN